MSHVVMLLANAFRPDPRVEREAEALTEAGHRVTIVCWDREGEYPPQETLNGYQVIRVQSVQTVYGAGSKQILYTPRFWRAAARLVKDLDPDVIHCHDLDTLPAGWWSKRRTEAKLVYDAHEDYPALMSLYLPRPMVRMLSWLERRLLKRVDYTITASTVFADKLRTQGVDPVVTLGNYQPLAPFDAVTEAEVNATRAQLGLQPDDFAVAYLGVFSRNRRLLPLVEAVRELPTVRLFLWGDGHQREEVEVAAAQAPNVRYLGWLPSEEAPLYMQAVDAIYYCLLPDYPGAIYNAPNALTTAMAAGRPIIANEVGDLGRIVRSTGCGILVPETSSEAIRAAIERLRDPVTRRRIGEAGRRAAEETYNWQAAAKRLQQIYESLEDQE
jgi:glycosyltransferase involved in cell wall biosynthesis